MRLMRAAALQAGMSNTNTIEQGVGGMDDDGYNGVWNLRYVYVTTLYTLNRGRA